MKGECSMQCVRASPAYACRAAVGRVVARLFRPAPVVFHMLEPMDARPKEKRQVVRQKRKAQVGESYLLGCAGLQYLVRGCEAVCYSDMLLCTAEAAQVVDDYLLRGIA